MTWQWHGIIRPDDNVSAPTCEQIDVDVSHQDIEISAQGPNGGDAFYTPGDSYNPGPIESQSLPTVVIRFKTTRAPTVTDLAIDVFGPLQYITATAGEGPTAVTLVRLVHL